MQNDQEVERRRRELREHENLLTNLRTRKASAKYFSSPSADENQVKYLPIVAPRSPVSNRIQRAVAAQVDFPPTTVENVDFTHSLRGIRQSNIGDVTELIGQDGYVPELDSLMPKETKSETDRLSTTNFGKSGEDSTLKYQITMRDQTASQKRAVTAITYHKKFNEVVMTGHGSRSDGKIEAHGGTVAIWTMGEGRGTLERVLNSHASITALEQPSISPFLVIGGTITGGILMWDTRSNTSLPVGIVANDGQGIDDFHGGHPVTGIKTTDTASPFFLSCSSSGHICKWSLSRPDYPISRDQIQDVGGALELNISSIDFPKTARLFGEDKRTANRATSLFVGAEDGGVYRMEGTNNGWTYERESNGHQTAVTAVASHPSGDRVPFLDDVILTCSKDWTIKLWNCPQGHKSSLLMSHDMINNGVVNDVSWSCDNPTLFCAVDESGVLSLFDVSSHLSGHRRTHKLHFTVPNTENSRPNLLKVQWSPNDKQICAGDVNGDISLWTPGANLAGLPDADWMGQFLKAKLKNED